MNYAHKLFTAAKTPFIYDGNIYQPLQSSIKASEGELFTTYVTTLGPAPNNLDTTPLVALKNLEVTIVPLIRHARKSPVKALQKIWLLDGTPTVTDLQTVRQGEWSLPLSGSYLLDAYQLEAALRTLVEDSVELQIAFEYLYLKGKVLKKQEHCWLYAIPLRPEQHYATKLQEQILSRNLEWLRSIE